MPTLRLEVTVMSSVMGGSAYGGGGTDRSYLESIVADARFLMVLKCMGQVSFFEFADVEGDSVAIRQAYPSNMDYYWGVWSSSTEEYTEHPLEYTELPSEGDTYRLDITIPDAIYARLQQCNFVDYNKDAGVMWTRYGDITFVSGGWTLPYDFVTSTSSYVRGEIVGADATLFDSSEVITGPIAEVYGNHTSPLHWTFVPDIFWTQRILCEETQ